MDKKIKIMVMCGSMRFQDEMIRTAYQFELERGVAVLVPTVIPAGKKHVGGAETNETAVFDKIHRRKIDLCDAIYVMNVGGYIGNSTRGEIEYAKKQGKEIIYHVV